MLDKCANPVCPAIFRKLRDGRLFVVEVQAVHPSSASELGRQRQYFWLCTSCCRTMTIIFPKGRARVVPLQKSELAARAASCGSL